MKTASWNPEARLKSKQGATTAISFVLQIILIGVLVLLPLVFTEALPKQQLMTFLVAPPPPPPPPPPPAAAPEIKIVKKIQSDLDNGQLRTPTAIPKKVAMIKEDEAATAVDWRGWRGGWRARWRTGRRDGRRSGRHHQQRSGRRSEGRDPAARARVAGRLAGLLIRQVKPNYPPLARQARIQGTVVLQAVISKDGSIENLHLVSGHPMLAPAAIDAVKQWKYKPYFLNGEPVEVETTINVNFTLAGG